MGMDVYVGPLTRYLAGDWLTVVQQMGLQQGFDVNMVRLHEQDDVPMAEIQEAVAAWQKAMTRGLQLPATWDEDPSLPYETDKPDWDGYGGMVLLAAYDERPELRDAQMPDDYASSPAFQAASQNPARYPSLLTGVQWWLPIDLRDACFDGPAINGDMIGMASTGQLLAELSMLAERLGMSADDLAAARQAGPSSDPTDVDAMGRFGLAVFHHLATVANDRRQPLVLDY